MAETENAKIEGFYIVLLKIGKIQFVRRCGQGMTDFDTGIPPNTKTTPATTKEENKMYRYISHAELPQNLCSIRKGT